MFLHHHPKELPIFTHVSDPPWEKGQCVTAGNTREDRPSSLRINMTRFGSWILLSCLALRSLTCTWSSLPPKAFKGWRGAKTPTVTGIESCLTTVGSLSPFLSEGQKSNLKKWPRQDRTPTIKKSTTYRQSKEVDNLTIKGKKSETL